MYLQPQEIEPCIKRKIVHTGETPGFSRTMEELDAAISVFKKQQDKIEALISNCSWLNNKYKKEMSNYLEEFFKIIDSKSSVKYNFIDNARTQ